MQISQLIAKRNVADIITCESTSSLATAARVLAQKRIGAVPVVDDGHVVGIFSERDILYRLAEDGPSCLDRSVGEVMTAEPITVAASATVDEALALMTRRRVRHLPVMDGATMCGFISIGDLVKSRIDEIEHEAEALRNYIQTA